MRNTVRPNGAGRGRVCPAAAARSSVSVFSQCQTPSTREPGEGRRCRRGDRSLSNQLLPVRSCKAALCVPGPAISSLNTFPEHAARRRNDERDRCEKSVCNEEPDEVGSGLGTSEHVRFESHVRGPKQSECNIYSHITVYFLSESIRLRVCRVSGQMSPRRGTLKGFLTSERRVFRRNPFRKATILTNEKEGSFIPERSLRRRSLNEGSAPSCWE